MEKIIAIETKTIVAKKQIQITRSQLLYILDDLANVDVPPTAHVFVNVPGGGDWSGAPLGIDDVDVAIIVQWEETVGG